MFANALFAFLEDRGWLAKMPCEGFTKTPYLNEAVGYPIAAVGFYPQLRYGVPLPFPLHFILFKQTACHLAHEANVEQVFSCAGNLADPNMDPEFLAHLVMCAVNKKAFLPKLKDIKDKYEPMRVDGKIS